MTEHERAARELYAALLDCWNRRDAAGMAALFAPEGAIVGFDGSQAATPAAIEGHLTPIFTSHPTPAYVAKVRGVRALGPDVALLQAVAGLVPPGRNDINPTINAVQTMLASRDGGRWRIELFQNTPAALHGQPEAAAALTEELRQVLHSRLA